MSTTPPLSLSAAAGHGETLLAQAPGNKCGEHFFHITADTGDYPNPTVSHTRFQRLRNAGANQRFNAEFCQLSRTLVGRGFVHHLLLSGNFPAIGQFDQQQLPGNVKDRRYAALPDWNGESHSQGLMQATCQALRHMAGNGRNISAIGQLRRITA
jgi:hypothetical protein